MIVESVGIKDRAFEALFKGYPDRLDEIMRYHLSHNATVRFEKFRYITERILGEKYSEKNEKELSEEFSRLVFKRIVDCPYVPGAEDFLRFFYKKAPIYLASASPAGELERIIEARALRRYFKKIYAIPWVKKDVIRDILSNENISSKEAVFIGDSLEDYEAAGEAGVFFIGRYSSKSFNGAEAPIYKDLFEIKDFLLKYE